MFRKPSILLILLIVFSSKIFGQNCTELIAYRDQTLLQVYNSSFNDYLIKQNGKVDFQKIKTELLNDSNWVAPDWRLLTSMIAIKFKMIADLTNGLLAATPAGQAATTAAGRAQDVYQLLKGGAKINSLIKDGAETFVIKEIILKNNPYRQSIELAQKLSADLNQLTTIPQDHLKYKQDVKNALDGVEIEFIKLRTAIEGSEQKIVEINEYKEGIDRYLNEECSIAAYRSPLINSNLVNFGIPNFCSWSMQFLNINVKFTLNKINKTISGATATHLATERRTAGNCSPAGRKTFNYSQESYSVNGNDIVINFSPSGSNHQKCHAKFIGRVGPDGISGSIRFKRYDQQPQINYRIEAPITVNKI